VNGWTVVCERMKGCMGMDGRLHVNGWRVV